MTPVIIPYEQSGIHWRMIQDVTVQLLYAPSEQFVLAAIRTLTDELIDRAMQPRWWDDASLKKVLDPKPIDRDWDWHEMSIEYEGSELRSERVAIVTGDGEVQGAMLISTEAVPSALEAGCEALFVELLFTAPRNRPPLRLDNRPLYVGVGRILLAWGAWFSRECGYEGRLRLDGSPDFIGWYRNRGFVPIDQSVPPFEGIRYTPMELPVAQAPKLIAELSS